MVCERKDVGEVAEEVKIGPAVGPWVDLDAIDEATQDLGCFLPDGWIGESFLQVCDFLGIDLR